MTLRSIPFQKAFLTLSSLALATAAYGQNTVAHWTFDSASLTTDGGGNIVGVADATANHNMTPGSGLGSGTGNPYTSNPIPGANAVSGMFGGGLTLSGLNTVAGGGGQYLMFPELTEITAAGGGQAYSISYWLNTTVTVNQQFTLLGDWGNSATTPGKFAYGFGLNFSSGNPQMRGQARFDNASAGGADIFARAVTATGLNNGSWHMLTWTFDPSIKQLKSYYDGNLLETFNSAAASGVMVTPSSAFGTLGLKGDSGNFLNGTVNLDEMWVFNGVLDQGQITSLYGANSVPEPTSLALLGVGALFLGVIRRRK
jgi:hypothetical protein